MCAEVGRVSLHPETPGFDMKTVYKAAVAATALVLVGFTTSRMINDGGIQAVIKDEVPALLDEWGWANESEFARYAAHIPASLAVFVGLRAGDADYDQAEHRDALTQGIPLHLHRNIMRHDNLAAAQRARSRQLQRLAAQDTEQRFYDLFPEWRASHTACMTDAEAFESLRRFAPNIASRIEATNAEFAALAAKEADGTLTVSERETYLAHPLRVPHLVQTGSEWYQWAEVDPSEPFSLHRSEGPLVRECPSEDHSYGWRIKSCFGYVNIDLGYVGSHPRGGHLAPTIEGRAVYRNLEQSGQTLDFVLQMMDDQAEQAALRRQAEQIVANLPASEVSAGFADWRVQAEYERLRCSK